MRPREISEVLEAVLKIGDNDFPPIFMWGPVGIGKSSITRQATHKNGFDYVGTKLSQVKDPHDLIGFIDTRMALKDPSDLKGLPFPEAGMAKWLPPSEFPREGRGIWFLDELNLAPPLVQAAAYQLILDRRVGDYIIPAGWRLIAAGNRAEHGANIFKMAAPLRNRFIHVDVEVHHDDWREYAMKNGFASEVIEFISFMPAKLYSFDPARHDNAFPTPRTWEFVSTILKTGTLRSDLKDKLIQGTIGEGTAIEFKGYLRVRAEMPNLDEILAGKNLMTKSDGVDVRYALVTGLVIKARPEQFERLLQYSEYLKPEEIAALMIKLMIQKDKKAVLQSPSWKKMSQQYYELLTFD